MTKILVILGAVIVLAGCGGGAKATVKNGKTLYARVGGMPAVKALVSQSLDKITKDNRVNEYFKNFDLEPVKEHLTQLVCVVTGGPCKYEGRGMKPVHAGMHISNSAFDALLEDILFTARKLKVPQAERDEIAVILNSQREDIVEIK